MNQQSCVQHSFWFSSLSRQYFTGIVYSDGQAVSVHATWANGRGGGRAPVILNFNSRWRWVVSCTKERESSTHWKGGHMGQYWHSRHFGQKKNLLSLLGIKAWFPGCPAHTAVPTQWTVLPYLLLTQHFVCWPKISTLNYLDTQYLQNLYKVYGVGTKCVTQICVSSITPRHKFKMIQTIKHKAGTHLPAYIMLQTAAWKHTRTDPNVKNITGMEKSFHELTYQKTMRNWTWLKKLWDWMWLNIQRWRKSVSKCYQKSQQQANKKLTQNFNKNWRKNLTFWKRKFTIDETLVFQYDPETKQCSFEQKNRVYARKC